MASTAKDPDAKDATLVDKSHFLCSEPFKFLIGDQATYVHADLITQNSKPLDRMIHGSLVEAKQGFATLEDVDLDTFLRFVQWLYYGYYDPAEPRSLASSERPNNNIYDAHFQAKELFVQRRYTVRNLKKDAPQPRPNSSNPEDYSEVFLGHARLYVFAEKYDVSLLKILAMEELHATLAVYTLYQERTGDIVALLRYVYANTADSKDGVEDLRTLLTQYMEAEIDILIKGEELQELMIEDGGPLLGELMKVMRKKLT